MAAGSSHWAVAVLVAAVSELLRVRVLFQPRRQVGIADELPRIGYPARSAGNVVIADLTGDLGTVAMRPGAVVIPKGMAAVHAGAPLVRLRGIYDQSPTVIKGAHVSLPGWLYC